jgi:hypothetical protein
VKRESILNSQNWKGKIFPIMFSAFELKACGSLFIQKYRGIKSLEISLSVFCDFIDIVVDSTKRKGGILYLAWQFFFTLL